MAVEARVLSGDGCLYKIWGKLVIADVGPVLDMEGRKHLAVVGKHLGRKLVVRMFKLFK